MKNAILLICLLFATHVLVKAQSVNLSYPIHFSVLQRGYNNGPAAVYVAGQLLIPAGIPAGAYIQYRFSTLNASGGVVSTGSPTNVTVKANGLFHGQASLTKGWYLVEILYNNTIYNSAKFGVGDVFVIAGQSNAQGIGTATDPGGAWQLPSVTGFPEWIVGNNADGNCTNRLPEANGGINMYSLSNPAYQYNRLAPTGNNVWCYAALGKKISDQNGGMPVAFFNAASGGSTITQWERGTQNQPAPNWYTNQGDQFCLGYNEGSINPSDYYGQPYTPLRTTLNYYASIFGVRGILWHQGEADSDGNVPATFKASSSSDYQVKLGTVIAKARYDSYKGGLSFFISRASLSLTGPINATVRGGQLASMGPATYQGSSGPDTDYITGSSGTNTASYRRDGTHFENNAIYSNGLDKLADKWFSAIGSSGTFHSPGFVPNIEYSKSGSIRTYTAPLMSTYTYRWGTSINTPIGGANSNVFSTTVSYSNLRCYMQDARGNWYTSAAIVVNNGGSSRIAAEDDEIGTGQLIDDPIQPVIFPNPYTDRVTVEFVVKEPNSQVKLEIINQSGNVVKTIVDNSHAKGTWQYPVVLESLPKDGTYFCRIRVNQIATVKKLVRAVE